MLQRFLVVLIAVSLLLRWSPWTGSCFPLRRQSGGVESVIYEVTRLVSVAQDISGRCSSWRRIVCYTTREGDFLYDLSFGEFGIAGGSELE